MKAKMKTQAKFYRQGDVGLMLVATDTQIKQREHKAIPRDGGRVVLAYGEVTGHAHAIAEADAELIELKDGAQFLVTERGVSLRHEEHSPIKLPGGTYRLIHQREYAPNEVRNVRD